MYSYNLNKNSYPNSRNSTSLEKPQKRYFFSGPATKSLATKKKDIFLRLPLQTIILDHLSEPNNLACEFLYKKRYYLFLLLYEYTGKKEKLHKENVRKRGKEGKREAEIKEKQYRENKRQRKR